MLLDNPIKLTNGTNGLMIYMTFQKKIKPFGMTHRPTSGHGTSRPPWQRVSC